MGYFLTLGIFVIICVVAFYYMTFHNDGVKPANWEDDK